MPRTKADARQHSLETPGATDRPDRPPTDRVKRPKAPRGDVKKFKTDSRPSHPGVEKSDPGPDEKFFFSGLS